MDIDSGNDNVLEFSTIGGIMRYYIITGNNYQSIMRQYHDLTGYQPMLPVWAFGNLMSRMAYRNQDETDSIVRMMEEEDFPIDAVILDFTGSATASKDIWGVWTGMNPPGPPLKT